MKTFLQISILLLVCLALATSTQAAQVNGLVTDVNTNLPVSNAKIFALGYSASGDSIMFDACTGKDGYYLLDGMPTGVYNIWCQHPDYFKSPSSTVQLSENEPFKLNFELTMRTSDTRNHISGHVYSTPPLLPAFIPLAGAKVWLTGENGTTLMTRTDNEGKYAFYNITPGVYTVSAAAEGHESAIDVEKFEVEPDTHIEHLDIYLIPLEPVQHYQLSGTVYDHETKLPVYPAYITVVLNNLILDPAIMIPEIISITVRNNEDGTYLIKNIPAGIFDVMCTARGYGKMVVPQVDFTAADQILDFYLKPIIPPYSNLLAGTVYDGETGDVLPEVQLTLSSLIGPELDRPEFLYQTRSDREGYYQFHDIQAGKYRLTALKRGYQPFLDTLEITDNTWITDFDIKMKAYPPSDQVTLWGHVWEAGTDRIPVYPAHIEVIGYNTNGDSRYYHTYSNPDGSYKIPEILPGYYMLKCSARNYETEIFYRIPLFEPEVPFDFRMTPKILPQLGTISGKVYFDKTSAPVYRAQIHFMPMLSTQSNHLDANSDLYRTYTNERGLYKANLPPGRYIVSCRYQYNENLYVYHEYYDNVHALDEATPVPVIANETIDGIDFGIPGPFTLTEIAFTGRVTDDAGQPLARALVRVWELMLPTMRASIHTNTYSAYTNENGEYKILINLNLDQSFAPWPVHAFISAANKEGYMIEFFEEKPSIYEADIFWAMSDTVFTDVNFTLEPVQAVNSISGQVTGADDLPLANAFVVGIPARKGELSMTLTDEKGMYTLNNLENKSYYILYLAQGYIPEFYDDATIWEDATPVLADGAVMHIDAELTPFRVPLPFDSLHCMLAGRVMNQNGNPVEGALITVRNQARILVGYGMTDPFGAYQIEGLSDGSYEATITKVNFASETALIEINSEKSDVNLYDFSLSENLTSVPEYDPSQASLPTQFALLPNYPNPFNPSTKIDFTLPEARTVDLSIFDILGRKIKTLVQEALPPGRYSVTWNGSDTNNRPVSSGVYFYVLETPGQRLAGKLVLNR